VLRVSKRKLRDYILLLLYVCRYVGTSVLADLATSILTGDFEGYGIKERRYIATKLYDVTLQNKYSINFTFTCSLDDPLSDAL